MTVEPSVEVHPLVSSDVDASADLLTRAMQDRINVAVYGDEPTRRARATRRLFATLLGTMTNQTPVVAIDGGTLVGVAGIAPAGTCQPSGAQRLRFVPGVVAAGPRTAARMNRWLSSWAAHDPSEPHSHFGPFATRAGRAAGSAPRSSSSTPARSTSWGSSPTSRPTRR